jgi:hypothetical protein
MFFSSFRELRTEIQKYPNLELFGSCVCEMQGNGLETLAAAAAMLEKKRQDKPTPDPDTERDKRKNIARVRQFEQMRQKKQASLSTCLKIPHKPVIRDVADELLGKILWKKFVNESGKPTWYQGEVVSVCRVKRDRYVHSFGAGVTSTVKYHVLYDDGDSEDMTRDEVIKYLVH